MTQPLALGIDIGGTGTALGIVNRRGQILCKDEMVTTGYETVGDFIAALRARALPLLRQVGPEQVIGCGVGAPNANFYTGEIAYAANLPWKGVIPLARLISEALNLRVVITNDANAAALGEMTYGAARGMKDFVMVTLGTGLGSGFVSNGQLIYGHDGFAGELGHITAVRDGRPCGCGRTGCLETYVSATGIVTTARQWLHERPAGSMLAGVPALTALSISEAAAQGDALALEIFEFTGRILGQCLADVVAITSPEAFIFFGGLAQSGALLLRPARRHMEANLLRVFQNKVAFVPSALADADAAILGASALIW